MANYSRQRKVILDILKSTKSHPTANEVYLLAKKEIPNISLGTVYRNLDLLAQSGEIDRLSFGDKNEHFDYDTTAHLHLHCTVCGKTVDVPTEDTAVFCAAVENGFLPQKSVMTVYGVCNNCKSNINIKEK